MEIGTGLLDSGLTTRQIELPAGSIGPRRGRFRHPFEYSPQEQRLIESRINGYFFSRDEMDFKKLEGNNFSFKFFVKIDRKINHQFQIVCLYFIFSTDFRRIKKLLCIGRFFDLIEETKFLRLFRSSVLRVWIFGRDPSAMKVRLCIWQILAVTLKDERYWNTCELDIQDAR